MRDGHAQGDEPSAVRAGRPGGGGGGGACLEASPAATRPAGGPKRCWSSVAAAGLSQRERSGWLHGLHSLNLSAQQLAGRGSSTA